MAYDDEEESFRLFQRLFPEHATLLVDTYDTLAAIDKIIASGLCPMAVRLDSGNLVELSREVRRRLDQGGLDPTRIFVTSDLDEYVITEMLAREDENTEELLATWGGMDAKSKKAPVPGLSKMKETNPDLAGLPSADLAELVQQLTEQMHAAAAELQFEVAARIRDEISDLKRELRQMMEATR